MIVGSGQCVLCRDEIYELLNEVVSFVIGCFDFGRRLGGLLRPMVKQRIRQRAANTLVEEDDHGGYALALFGEPIAVARAVTLQQAVALHLAQIVAELAESVWHRRKANPAVSFGAILPMPVFRDYSSQGSAPCGALGADITWYS